MLFNLIKLRGIMGHAYRQHGVKYVHTDEVIRSKIIGSKIIYYRRHYY